jgi:hypothetical protein
MEIITILGGEIWIRGSEWIFTSKIDRTRDGCTTWLTQSRRRTRSLVGREIFLDLPCPFGARSIKRVLNHKLEPESGFSDHLHLLAIDSMTLKKLGSSDVHPSKHFAEIVVSVSGMGNPVRDEQFRKAPS